MQKMQFHAKICKFYVKITTFFFKFLKMRMKCAKICNLYVKFDTKVEKGGHWMWTEEKRGSFRTLATACHAHHFDR